MVAQPRKPGQSRVEETARKLNQKLSEAEKRIQSELDELVTYLDQELVPTVRQHSSRTLRSLAEKMTRMAEYMEKGPPRKS